LPETVRIMFIFMIDQFQCIKIRIWLRYSLFFCFLLFSLPKRSSQVWILHSNKSYRNWSITGQFSHYLMHGSLLWDPFYIIRKSIVIMSQQTVVHCIIFLLEHHTQSEKWKALGTKTKSSPGWRLSKYY